MRKIFTLIFASLAIWAVAQTPKQVLDRAVAAIKDAGTVTATYALSGSQGCSRGTITMSGNKYRLISPDVKCWYDGTTLWTYSTATGEVNVTTPTTADMQVSNPYAAMTAFKQNYNLWKAAGQVKGSYAVMLMPKKKAPVERLYAYIDNATHLINNLHVKMTDGSAYTITLNDYKTHVSVPASSFTYDPSQVPPGTEVVDLR